MTFLDSANRGFADEELIGSYIADFFCYNARLVVEIDGSQHFSAEKALEDDARTAYFHTLGIRVMRVDNGEVNRNFSGVCEGILMAMKQCGVEAELEIE